jgi:glycosyltransferase involved in cell wall biosynthesis
MSLRYKKVSFLRRRMVSAALSRFRGPRRAVADPLRTFASLGGAYAGVDQELLRGLRDGLRDRGYLRKAFEVAQAIRGRPDRWSAALIAGEIAVLSGESRLSLVGKGFEPVQGRVLHLVGNSLPYVQSGYTLRTHYTAVAQRAAGLDPHVVTQLGFGYYGVDEIEGVRYHRLAGQGRGTKRLRPAVLHAASDFVNAVTALAVGRALGIPVVYESRGFWEETWLQRQAHRHGPAVERHLPDVYRWRREIEDRCRREADAVVTLAEVMADRIVAGGVPRERITVVPNAVDAESFPVRQRDPELATQLGIDEQTKVIGYVSSIVPYEGIDTLVEAVARLDSPVPVRLLVVGDGPEREPLRRKAQALGLGDAVFTGAVPHTRVLDYYGLIDLFVVPRRPDEVCHLVTPLKPFEAFATGRTVVLSDVRALAAIARESDAAELFPAGDAAALADVLAKLLSDPDRCRELAGRGARWVRAHRTWAANAEAYAKLYRYLPTAERSSETVTNS